MAVSVYTLPRIGRDEGYFNPAETDCGSVFFVEAAHVAVELAADAGDVSEDWKDDP